MYNRICGIYLALITLISLISHAEEITLEKLQGEWLNKQYVEALKRTKSPCKAYKTDESTYYTAFIIPKMDSSYFEWRQITGFHEGVFLRITGLQSTSEPNTYQILYHNHQTHGRITDNDRFFIPDGESVNELVWIFIPRYTEKREEQRITFIRVRPTIDEFVNRVVIAGIYIDKQERQFVFKESGDAVWPDKSFKYAVGLDRHWTHGKFDYFVVIGEKFENIYPMRYGFEWRDNKLLIFKIKKVNCDTTVEREEEPLFVLTPQ